MKEENLQLTRLRRDGHSEINKSLITTNSILEIFESFKMPPSAIDQYEVKGKEILRDKIRTFVSGGQAIRFVTLGFPFKSVNIRDKVLGISPDRGEEETLKNFALFHKRVKEIYDPGVAIVIVRDGYVFNEILKVHDRIVRMYGEASEDMTGDAPIEWYDMYDFYSKKMNIGAIREKVQQQFGSSDAELEKRILFDPNVNSLYTGMIRFMEEELAIDDMPSRNQLHKEAKRIAKLMMHMNEAYSDLVAKEFNNDIRLSIHQSMNDGRKYAFNLINSPLARHSPWHSSLVVGEDGSMTTMHKKDAEMAGYHLVYQDRKPYYFTTVK